MKQVEKLDRILRYLYDHRFDGNNYMLFGIVEELQLPVVGKHEVIELGQRLKKDGLVDAIGLAMGNLAMELNSYGVEYCEERSYGSPAQPVATAPINIVGSQQVVVVSHSPGANVVNHGAGTPLAQEIVQQAGKDPSLTQHDREELKQLLDEIQGCAAQGIKPKMGLDTLLSRFGNLSSVGSLVTSFAELLGA